MSTADDIVDFLKARLDEDEREARAGFSNQVDTENGWGEIGTAVTPHVGVIHEDIQRAHVVKWNPKRVLHGVEVKRRLLVRYERAVAAGDSHPSTYARGQDDGYRQACLDAIRDECSVYADHPDYRPDWSL